MLKPFLLGTCLFTIFGVFAQNFKNSFSLHYLDNSLVTNAADTQVVYAGGHVQLSNTTYLINHPQFSVGLGIGVAYSHNKFKDNAFREFSLPLSIVQKTNLPGLDPLLDYLRIGISRNVLLTSAASMNKGAFSEAVAAPNKGGFSAEAYLGWNFGDRGFAEVGYVFRQMSAFGVPSYGKHNLAAGIGLLLGEAPRTKQKALKPVE